MCSFEGKCVVVHSNVPEGGECGEYGSCAADLYCQADPTQSDPLNRPKGTCQKRKAVGEKCPTRYECALDLYCDPYDGTCKPRKAVGEPCKGYDECKDGYCDSSLQCVAFSDEPSITLVDASICLGKGG